MFETLMPQCARDDTDVGSQFAVYACENFDAVIPFALPIRWYPDDPGGKRAFSCDGGKIFIEYGSIDSNGIGYVYKVDAKFFEKADEWQWISYREVRPVDVIKVTVADYWHVISFSKEALEINKTLYPSDSLYLSMKPYQK